MSETLAHFQQYLQEHRLSGALISCPVNVTYLTGYQSGYPPSVLVGYGFNPSGFLVVPADARAALCVDPRYRGTAFEAQEVVDSVIIERKDGTTFLKQLAKEFRERCGGGELGLEKLYLTYKEGQELSDLLAESGCTFRDISTVIDKNRARKTESEREKLREAARITDEVFLEILPEIVPGISEQVLAFRIEQKIREKGAGLAFDVHVASGPNSAIPHHTASEKLLQKGELVLLDFGAKYRGYHGDMTRMVSLGTPSEKMVKVFSAVKEAKDTAMKEIRPGMSGEEAHNKALQVLQSYGFGEYFIHSLGHGTGLFIHEFPKIGTSAKDSLEAQQVFTIEPGVYLPGEFGVRVEDSVLLTQNGCERLNKTSDELHILAS